MLYSIIYIRTWYINFFTFFMLFQILQSSLSIQILQSSLSVPALLEYESIPGVLSSKPFGKRSKSRQKSIDHETEDIITVKDFTNKVFFHKLIFHRFIG